MCVIALPSLLILAGPSVSTSLRAEADQVHTSFVQSQRTCKYLDWGALKSTMHRKDDEHSAYAYSFSGDDVGGCGASHFAVRENVRLRPSGSGLELVVATRTHARALSATSAGEVPTRSVEEQPCTPEVTEDTFLVWRPRVEYFQNLYHAVEELFALVQTRAILGEDVDGAPARMIAAWSAADVLQPGTDNAGDIGRAPRMPQISEMFGKMLTATPLPALPLPPDPDGICFRRIILPMTACSGSVVPASWGSAACGDIPKENPFVSIPESLRSRFGVTRTAPSAKPQIVWIHRNPGERAFFDDGALLGELGKLSKHVRQHAKQKEGKHGQEKVRAEGNLAGSLHEHGNITEKTNRKIAAKHEENHETSKDRFAEPHETSEDIRRQTDQIEMKEQNFDKQYVEYLRTQVGGTADTRSVDFSRISFAEQMKVVNEADVLVARHGAGLVNLLFAKPTTAVVELTDILQPGATAGRDVGNIFYNLARWSFRTYKQVYVGTGSHVSPIEEVSRTVKSLLPEK